MAPRWKDVDWLAGPVQVRRNYTDRRQKILKGKKVRSVPMTPDVLNALVRLKGRGVHTGEDDLVFVNGAGVNLDSWALRRRYYAAIDSAGLRRITFPLAAPLLRLSSHHAPRPVRRAVLHGAPALLHDAALPAPPARAADALALHEAFANVSPACPETRITTATQRN